MPRKAMHKPTSDALAERRTARGNRRLKLTDGERNALQKNLVLEHIVAMYLDLTRDWTLTQMAEELKITVSQLKDLTRSEEFSNLYNQHFIELGHDPRLKATQAAIVDMLPMAQRELKALLSGPMVPAGVKLKAITEILRLGGVEQPKAAVNDKKELAEFLMKAGVNIENLNVNLPTEYRDIIEAQVIVPELPTSED
jgi:hypothetical protein